MTELEFIHFLSKKIFFKKHKNFVKIKNEDCAILKFGKSFFLFTTDTLCEDVHFSFKYFDFYHIGYKLGAVNLSDIAACGGTPLFAMLSISVPVLQKRGIEKFLQGVTDSLEKHGALLIGGDTTKNINHVFSLTLIGKSKNPILRKGARPEDIIFVSKPLGESKAFLRAIKNTSLSHIPENLVKAHLLPEPEVKLGKLLSASGIPSSMIDITDGFIFDLGRLCEENKVGAVLEKDKIPVGEHASLEDALFGGEDLALLFTVPEKKLPELKKIEISSKRKCYPVGKIVQEKGIFFLDENKKKPVKIKGYDHFNLKRSKE